MKKFLLPFLVIALVVSGAVGCILLTNTRTPAQSTVNAASGLVYNVTFNDNSGNHLYMQETSEIGYLTDIPSWTGYVPPLYRFKDWETKDGTVASKSLHITQDMDFYPTMEKNFDYAGVDTDKPKIIAYQDGQYDNSNLLHDFSNYVYNLPVSTNENKDNPFLLTDFSIQDETIPWDIKDVDCDHLLQFSIITYQGNLIPSGNVFQSGKTLKLAAYGFDNTLRLYFDSVLVKTWKWGDFVKQPNGSSNPKNKFTFSLSVVDNKIQYSITSTALSTNVGFLPNIFAYKYGSNEIQSFLGISFVNIQRYSRLYFYYGFLNLQSWSQDFSNYPQITVSGQYAKVQKQVTCHIGDQLFTNNLYLNSWQKPTIPDSLGIDPATIEWYLDSSFTQLYANNTYTARDFENLYGKIVPAQYEVTLVYYTTENVYVSDNNGLWYEALVKKTVQHTYLAGSIINLSDFGQNTNSIPFYDHIRNIPFSGWSSSLTATVSTDSTIIGQYKWPTATIYYYDIKGGLYGTVKQTMTMFPVDQLQYQLNLANSQNQNWWQGDIPANKGLFGQLWSMIDSVMRSLFGGDTVTTGQNAQYLANQKKQAKQVVDALAAKYSVNNQYFLPVVYLNINLQDLNKGAYGNSAFHVYNEKNPQWHCVSGTPELNDLVYFSDVSGMYSLTNYNFNLVVNFDKQITGFDSMAMAAEGFFGWVGNFFGSITGSLFGGLFSGLGGWGIVLTILLLVGIVLVCTFGMPYIVMFVQQLLKLIVEFVKWIVGLIIKLFNKMGGAT